MEFESVTMHLDRTFGLMYREDGELRCTCGWSEFGGTSDPTGSTQSSSGSGSHTPPAGTSSTAVPDAGCEEEFGEDADWELINHADWLAENEGER